MRPLESTLVLAVVAAFPAATLGQHDPQRNAVQHIAAGQYDKAGAELQKAEPDEPETRFVQMLAASAQEKTDAAVQHARAALDAGLPFERLLAGPRDVLAPLYGTTAFREWSREHPQVRLLHGPMLGAVTDDAASFWVRTAGEADVRVKVLEAAMDEAAMDQGDQEAAASKSVRTARANDRVAVLRVSGLRPGTAYRYEVLVDGERVPVENSRFRTFPRQGRPAEFLVGFGGGAGYVPKWEHMWGTVAKTRPLAFLMLGDNVYIDDPEHPLTQDYCYYRRQSRPEWRRLVASTNMAAIYDDHDFGTNDCVPGSEIEKPPWKRAVWERFRRNWVNPYYGGGEEQPGCWCDFYIGDVHFILLDGRYYRTRNSRPGMPKPSMLGPAQKAWLLETLKKSRGTFKVLASPVPFSEGVKPGSNDPWDGFPEEREEIFSFLENNRIDGVILIAADRHRTDLRVTPRPGGYDLYELESSRLTNRHTHGAVKSEGLIWGYNKTCSCALMHFDTTADDPRVRFEAMTLDGEIVHSHELRLSQIRHK